MTIEVRALRPLFGEYGAVDIGQVFPIDERSARKLESRNLVQRIASSFPVCETMAAISPRVAYAVPGGFPMVTAIMPTADRRLFVPGAVKNFLAQGYPNKELIVLDDGRQSVKSFLPNDQRVRYQRIDGKLTIGAKRNAACNLAVGPIIVHWDDDDRSHPDRIERQVRLMQDTQKPVVGFKSLLFYSPDSRDFHLYDGAPGKPGNSTALGTSLCYLRSWWRSHQFADINVAEDERFVAAAAGNIAVIDGKDLMVAYSHKQSTSPKRLKEAPFRKVAATLPDWAER